MTQETAQKIANIGHGWIPIKTDADFIANGKELLTAAFKKIILKICQELGVNYPHKLMLLAHQILS
jgi:hypothetical protein